MHDCFLEQELTLGLDSLFVEFVDSLLCDCLDRSICKGRKRID